MCGFEKQKYSQSPAGHHVETHYCIDPSRLFANHICLTSDCPVTVHIQYIVHLRVNIYCVVGFKSNQTLKILKKRFPYFSYGKVRINLHHLSMECKRPALIFITIYLLLNEHRTILEFRSLCFVLYMVHTHSLFSQCIPPCCPEAYHIDTTL